jgi:hypothetical protein
MITTRATPTPTPALAPFVRPPIEVIPVAVIVGLDRLEGLEDGVEVLETAGVAATFDG